jgi:hypothetical protein
VLDWNDVHDLQYHGVFQYFFRIPSAIGTVPGFDWTGILVQQQLRSSAVVFSACGVAQTDFRGAPAFACRTSHIGSVLRCSSYSSLGVTLPHKTASITKRILHGIALNRPSWRVGQH